MKLERLEIIHLPGLSSGFSLEGLAAGVNLITGPNAAGKSSLVRALGFLLRTRKAMILPSRLPPISKVATSNGGSSAQGNRHCGDAMECPPRAPISQPQINSFAIACPWKI